MSRQRRAFTLIELLVVLAIIIVATLLGAGTIQPYLPRYRMISVSKQLRADLRQLQSLAMQTGRQTRLRLIAPAGDCADTEVYGGGWELSVGDRSVGSTVWDILPEDALVDGSDDEQGQGRVDFGPDGAKAARGVCLMAWAALEGPGAGNTDSIVFSPRGSVANPLTDFADGTIRIRLANQAAAAEGVVDEAHVLVSAAGWTGLETTLGQSGIDGSVGAASSSSVP